MLVIRIFFIGPVGFEPVTKRLQVQFQHGTCNKGKMKGGKVGPAGIEPAACGLADNGFIPARYQTSTKY